MESGQTPADLHFSKKVWKNVGLCSANLSVFDLGLSLPSVQIKK